MDTPETPIYPDRMNGFMTSEHFTLQSARGIVNSEIVGRVNIYFTTLSSVLIAAAFIAQIPEMHQLFMLFALIAFPVIVLLGLFTLARVMALGHMDFEYIRAINRIRQFYVQATPEVQRFLLFPPHDDDRSVQAYAGYTYSFRGHLLSAAHAVTVTNSIVATVLISILINLKFGLTVMGFLPLGIGIFFVVYFLHGLLGSRLARRDFRPEYGQARFPAP